MSAFAEFVLVAILIYLWESTLWLPLRSVALRKRRWGNSWKTLKPGNLVATREVGLVAMLPFLPDTGLAPCQAPPLFTGDDGDILMQTSTGEIERLGPISWDDLTEESNYLVVGERRTRVSSPRGIALLRRARKRGATLQEAIHQASRLAFSPARAGREWKRWRLVSATLHINATVLTAGFFIGLPLVYLKVGTLHTALLAAWLWFLMVWTACHLWWLGIRVYPDARQAFRTDALLALLVPFHAMRAAEIASVHAMATTHPVGMLLATGDIANPLLGKFVRQVLHPMPGRAEDRAFQSALRPILEKAHSLSGLATSLFDVAPNRVDDPAAARYCPRCHSVYLSEVSLCPDCQGVPLMDFAERLSENAGRS